MGRATTIRPWDGRWRTKARPPPPAAAKTAGGAGRPLRPMLYRFFHYVAAEFLGLLPCLAPNMYDSAAVEAAAMFSLPVAVSSSAPPSMSGNPYGGHIALIGDLLGPPKGG